MCRSCFCYGCLESWFLLTSCRSRGRVRHTWDHVTEERRTAYRMQQETRACKESGVTYPHAHPGARPYPCPLPCHPSGIRVRCRAECSAKLGSNGDGS
ncbi:hypothetical protein NDU88_000882 [Pleurodeles waltl]|uniref:RBR-type E3 ubiquitin transferase n=1 Tax=Pleurodeles waltl TaxID=8319 RepID=A0AAV7N9G3_PLEWA|nr:hypothetical protein NDU88_000882 [Pleurodeles waltl]